MTRESTVSGSPTGFEEESAVMQRRAGCRKALLLSVLLGVAIWAATSVARPSHAAVADRARNIVRSSGVKGGLVVHVGCGDGRLTGALHVSEAYVVHGLDGSQSEVDRARQHLRSQGLYGDVTVEHWSGQSLPYVDNLINLLVIDESKAIPESEIDRVLAPRGVALIRENGRWVKKAKRWPEKIDEWTHFLHGPDNNAVADDTVAGPPRRMQWLAGPKWTRHHDWDKGTRPGFRAIVSDDGRVFYMIDEATPAHRAVPSRWFLVARDAFSGVRLWKKRLPVQSFPRRLEQLWRSMVAEDGRVYTPLAPGEPLTALNAATGEGLRTYDETAGLQEVITRNGALFALTKGRRLVTLRASTGEVLWEWEAEKEVGIVPLTLAASAERVFLKTDESVICLSAETGEQVWRFVPKIKDKRRRLRWPRARLIVKDGVVLCSYGGKNPGVLNRDRWQYLGDHPRVNEYDGTLAALSAETGEVLWKSAYRPGLESYPGDIFVVDGLVWPGPDFAEVLDLHTGEVQCRNPVIERLWTTGHHHRCYPEKATARYILNGKRGAEFIDIKEDNHSRNNWVRGTCRTGLLPCNGLLYAPPHSCGCYMEAKLYGFWALAPHQETNDVQPPATRLQKGPAYGKSGAVTTGESEGTYWPTYRHDPARSGSTVARVSGDELEVAWRTKIGSDLTPPVVTGGRIVLADVNAHRVVCLDASTGEAVWAFTAGGRVDSPPTIYKGMVLTGCADGYVYCLRLSDGRLMWRFLAASDGRKTVAFNQVESVWPVHGSVLLADGVVYAAAGRSSYLDGGVILYGLDPETGRVVYKSKVESTHPEAPLPDDDAKDMGKQFGQNKTDYKTFRAPDRSDAFSMSGATTDVLVNGDSSVYMRHLRLGDDLSKQEGSFPHLFSTSRLLDGAENHRSHWVLGTGDFSRTMVAYPWIAHRPGFYNQRLSVPYGLMLCFDDETVWGVRRNHMMRAKPEVEGNYMLYAQGMPARKSRPDFRKVSADNRPQFKWTSSVGLRPRSMLRTKSVLFIGGMPDSVNSRHPSEAAVAAFEGRRHGLLKAISPTDGSVLRTIQLEAPPVWDGMAAANGRLFICNRDGQIVCIRGGED